MSESDDIDTVLRRVREAFEGAVEEAEELSDQAREGVEEAIENLEARIEALRGVE